MSASMCNARTAFLEMSEMSICLKSPPAGVAAIGDKNSDLCIIESLKY